MSALYDVNGNELIIAYNVSGATIPVAYDIEGNPYAFDEESADYITKANGILSWLTSYAIDNATNGKRIKERYRMDTSVWVNMHRVYINMQGVVCFLHVWKHTGNNDYLTLARQVFDSIILLQNEDGSIISGDASDRDIYASGNAGNAVLMFQMAELDTERSALYIEKALMVTEYLLSLQTSAGSFPASKNQPIPTPMFTGHVVTALAAAYPHTTRKTAYAEAIASAIGYISDNTLGSGRVKCCYEINSGVEYWRPPMSDQSICALAVAFAEYYLPQHEDQQAWNTLRNAMLNYLDNMIAPIGAVRNGAGSGINGADIYGLTDHVYTTNFAINAYYFSYLVDDLPRWKSQAKRIIDFCEGNFYYSTNPNASGVLRGAWNIEDENWDTSELILNWDSEGGADMIYTGWINIPIAQWFYDVAYEDF